MVHVEVSHYRYGFWEHKKCKQRARVSQIIPNLPLHKHLCLRLNIQHGMSWMSQKACYLAPSTKKFFCKHGQTRGCTPRKKFSHECLSNTHKKIMTMSIFDLRPRDSGDPWHSLHQIYQLCNPTIDQLGKMFMQNKKSSVTWITSCLD